MTIIKADRGFYVLVVATTKSLNEITERDIFRAPIVAFKFHDDGTGQPLTPNLLLNLVLKNYAVILQPDGRVSGYNLQTGFSGDFENVEQWFTDLKTRVLDATVPAGSC